MFFIPVDLFSPWINARERAIDANWNDLTRSNAVQQGWLQNDAQQYRNWLTRDTYNDQVALVNARGRMGQNAAQTSDLNLRLAQLGQPGAEAQAAFGSDYLTQLTAANQPLIPTIAQNAATVTAANSAADVARANALRQYSPTIYDTQGQYAANRAQANLNLLPQQIRSEQALVGAQTAQNQYAAGNYNYGINANLFPQFQTAQPSQATTQAQTIPGNTTNMFAPNSVIPTTPQQPVPGAVPVDMQAVQGVLARVNVGAQVNIPLPSGGMVVGGRDEQGVYVIQNNSKVYLQPQAYVPRGDALDWSLPQQQAQPQQAITQIPSQINYYDPNAYLDPVTGLDPTVFLPAD